MGRIEYVKVLVVPVGVAEINLIADEQGVSYTLCIFGSFVEVVGIGVNPGCFVATVRLGLTKISHISDHSWLYI